MQSSGVAVPQIEAMNRTATTTVALFLVLAFGRPALSGPDDEPMKRVDDALQKQINDAVSLGAKALAAHQQTDGFFRFGGEALHASRLSLHQGQTALALLALIHSGMKRDDPVVKRGVAWLLRSGKTPGWNNYHGWTYANGLVIWLFATVDARLYEPEIRALAARLAHGARSDGTWGYYAGRTRGTGLQDASNMSTTQYAVLGLWEAQRAGVKLPRRTWERLVKALEEGQARNGGWAYTPPRGATTFTSTAIGVASLIIARTALATGKGPTDAEIRAALPVRRGLTFLANHWNEVKGARWTALDTYALYAAERAGMIADVNRFGSVDWYTEGARILVAKQNANGTWGSATENRYPASASSALALLFLTRATRPVATPTPEGPPDGTPTERTRIDPAEALKLPDDVFAGLVEEQLGRIASGRRRGEALETLESLSPRVDRFLVDRLAAKSRGIRVAAITTLHALHGTKRGYDPDGPADERAAAVEKWRKALDD